MPPPNDPLNPRALSSGLAQRTIKNLQYIQHAHEHGHDVHVGTQTINSLLSLLIFPIEKEKQFFQRFRKVKLTNPPHFGALITRGFPPLPTLRITQWNASHDLRRFFQRLRNAIAHRRLEFSSDDHDLDHFIITLQDQPRDHDRPVDWEIKMSVNDLGGLATYIANRIIQQQL